MSSNKQYALQTDNVRKGYRLGSHTIQVLEGVDLTVKGGEWVAFVGASGSGKTTLLHLLGTLDVPDEGEVQVLGKLFPELTSRERSKLRRDKIGMVFQNYYLFPELSAIENAALPALHWWSDRRRGFERAGRLLRDFGLAERFNHRPAELSGGEQQRVAMARALINDPEIILADEPTGNLDDEAAGHILDILRSLQEQEGKTIVIVTHDHAIAECADRKLLLADGMVQAM
ncbi:MAG: ABC transporter ATP-binding protein [Verrucomicrobiota bacterium]